MAEGSRSSVRASSPSWLASLMGAVFLISAGFMLGLVVGVVKEEPGLLMGHLGGQSEEVRWSEQEAALGTADVAAAGPGVGSPDVPGAHDLRAPGSPGLDSSAVADLAGEIHATGAIASSRALEAADPVAASTPRSEPRAARSRAAGPRAKGFSVQVGAFSETESADRIADDLRLKGFRVYVTPQARSRDGRWRVRVGPMATRAEAEEIAQQLKTQERLPTWVLSESGS